MDFGQILSWVVGAVGLTGFYFAGKRVWWSWYINLGCQILWASYALVTGQPAFLVTAAVYSVIFGRNAYKWTKDHRNVKRILASEPVEAPHKHRMFLSKWWTTHNTLYFICDSHTAGCKEHIAIDRPKWIRYDWES